MDLSSQICGYNKFSKEKKPWLILKTAKKKKHEDLIKWTEKFRIFSK
jgi:hypothetical protein